MGLTLNPGWLTFAGVEIASGPRTSAYVNSLGLGWFQPQDVCHNLEVWLGQSYSTPEGDGAPWIDPARPETKDFAGFFPLEVEGGTGSTLSRTVTPRLDDGGIVGAAKHGPRTLVVRGVLLGKTMEAVASGGSWLNSVLAGRLCPQPIGGEPCAGWDLDYFGVCPGACGCGQPVCDSACVDKWQRHLYGVLLTEGPEVLETVCLPGNRGAYAEVQFTLTASNPYHYGNVLDARQYAFAFTYTEFAAAFAPSYANLLATVSSYAEVWDYMWDLQSPGPATLMLVDDALLVTPTALPIPGGYSAPTPPLIDPDCPPLPSFPPIPQADIYCGDLYSGTWNRTTFRMQSQDTSRWMIQLPIITLHDATRDHEDIRIRFTPEGGSPDADYISQFYVTWLPMGSTMTLNAPRDRVLLDRGYGQERAEHLVIMDSRGQPLRWPVVSCGGSWIITVDLPSADVITGLEIELALVTAEP
jgi:hypothetical protein